MLDSLNAHHEAILTVAGDLEALAQAAEPDTVQLANARFRIAKLSSARTRFLEQDLYPLLLRHLDTADAEAVRRLRDDRLQNLAQTAHHIGAWSSKRITAEWAEYRRVFADLLRALRTRVAAEKTILAPSIQKVHATAHDAS